ncbi:WYL domain-containing protein [Flavitalea sp. BT771]|uniref:helix-turn-helix transcriptional regulator n=1 Tax=Flavitalea sp. BT771 TaxID=3063329 RepID=UPI0026E42B69|nr:WYL domain-containing protein [Flavitalea sp. BT771]MDO6433699.1 WYL domain-containing protein [Flavitalea sp. BT771]MDV6222396.1 WYL domain-containing protein [Flavitalea sp. BT771]
MPINRNALIRYRTIDKCLQNRRRKWTIEDLIEACNEALYEFEGIQRGVSLRTIRLDLNAMRSDKLGYNAPIIVRDRKYYSYEDPAYSITNIPLSARDLGILQEVSGLLHQFKGFSHFTEMSEMISRLEDKIHSEQNHSPSVIDFEKNELLTGIQWLDVLYKAIISRTTVQLSYQSFKARTGSSQVFYPYLLKEYRNRWFVLGMLKSGKAIITFALDRIQDIMLLPSETFRWQKDFDPHTYFLPIVGVTRNTGEAPMEVIFWASHVQAPYIKTKPIHPTQKILEEVQTGTHFSIVVIPNFELERELMGFGEGLKVLSPARLVRIIQKKVRLMNELYHPSTGPGSF